MRLAQNVSTAADMTDTDPELTELGMARVALSGLIDENKMLRAEIKRLENDIATERDAWAKDCAEIARLQITLETERKLHDEVKRALQVALDEELES
jgi:hypothetical protein